MSYKTLRNNCKKDQQNFSVKLPFSIPDVKLPINYSIALRCVVLMKKHLSRKPVTSNQYVEFMTKLFQDGHAVVLKRDYWNSQKSFV